MGVDERVAALMAGHRATARAVIDPVDRLAARHLFSTMCHLERLAELAAERGDGVPGQLDDERVHRQAFRELAEMHGGLEPCPEPAQKLIDYLLALEGESSLATLNVVAESWLDTVFEHMERSWLAPSVFHAIEEDEARHAYGALESARLPEGDAGVSIVRDLESMLMEISLSGEFMLPLVWFLGPTGVAEMGMDIAAAHARACARLGVEPDLRDLVTSCRAARFLDRTAPTEWPMNEWDRLKLANWKTNAPQLCFVDIDTDTTNPVKLQAQAMHALGRVLAREPELRRVVRRDRLYMTDHPVVGMRALYDKDRVVTLFVSRPERYPPRRLIPMLNKQLKRFKDEPYEPYDGPISVVPHLEPLFPPNRCNVVLSYNGGHGGLFGVGPLSHLEGIPCSVTIGEPHWKPVPPNGSVARISGFGPQVEWRRVVTVCVQMDHRVGDGRHIGLLAGALRDEIPAVQREMAGR